MPIKKPIIEFNGVRDGLLELTKVFLSQSELQAGLAVHVQEINETAEIRRRSRRLLSRRKNNELDLVRTVRLKKGDTLEVALSRMEKTLTQATKGRKEFGEDLARAVTKSAEFSTRAAGAVVEYQATGLPGRKSEDAVKSATSLFGALKKLFLSGNKDSLSLAAGFESVAEQHRTVAGLAVLQTLHQLSRAVVFEIIEKGRAEKILTHEYFLLPDKRIEEHLSVVRKGAASTALSILSETTFREGHPFRLLVRSAVHASLKIDPRDLPPEGDEVGMPSIMSTEKYFDLTADQIYTRILQSLKGKDPAEINETISRYVDLLEAAVLYLHQEYEFQRIECERPSKLGSQLNTGKWVLTPEPDFRAKVRDVCAGQGSIPRHQIFPPTDVSIDIAHAAEELELMKMVARIEELRYPERRHQSEKIRNQLSGALANLTRMSENGEVQASVRWEVTRRPGHLDDLAEDFDRQRRRSDRQRAAERRMQLESYDLPGPPKLR